MIRNQRELGENSERLRDRDFRETREQRCREERDRDLERRGQRLSRGEK